MSLRAVVMRRASSVNLVVLLFATLLVAACGPTGHGIVGSLLLTSDSIDGTGGVGSTCKGTGGYKDMTEGATVTVKNEAGTIIATGALAPGVFDASVGLSQTCRFAFSVPTVPDAAFYSIEVAHRGALTYSKADMESRKWSVELTLGA